jgi:hypothetical protein
MQKNNLEEHLACLKQLNNNPERYNLTYIERQKISNLIDYIEGRSMIEDIKPYGELVSIVVEIVRVFADIFGNSS